MSVVHSQLHTAAANAPRRAAKVALIASTPNTTRPGSEATSLVVGDRVRCERAEPTKGTWSRYAGREGVVVSVNRETFPAGRGTYVEVGVNFTGSAGRLVWFRADELVAVEVPLQPFLSRQSDLTASVAP